MISLTPNYELVYKIQDTSIFISDLYERHSYHKGVLAKYPGLKQIKNTLIDGFIRLEYKNIDFSIFHSQMNFYFSDKDKRVKVCSFVHLQKIIEIIGYKSPCYRKASTKDFSPLSNVEKIKEFLFINEEIIVKDKEDVKDYSESFKDFSKHDFTDIDIYSEKIKIKDLSLNFQHYFSKNNFQFNEEQEIPIFHSRIRYNLLSKIFNFIKDNNKKMYAVCGPFGIGKTFTSLLLQKHLSKDIKTLYINLANKEEINPLKDTIIKEILFLKLEENDFNTLIKKILTSDFNSIWDIIKEIDKFCSNNQIDFLLILDQYQKSNDEENNLFELKVKKIILLSSINDKEVKDYLVSILQKKTDVRINYDYIMTLDIKITDIKEYTKINDIKIRECIKLFDNLPISFFLLENSFNWNVLNFLNFQFLSILEKMKKFFDEFKIDFIEKLHNENKINEQNSSPVTYKSIPIEDFINNIKQIPLKYFSYKIIDDLYVQLFYAFQYVKNPLQSEIFFRIGINALLSKKEKGFVKGEKFETLIFHKFILDKALFGIDNFITVSKIVEMNLVDEYIYINVQDLLKKKCILISQKIFQGEDYDFSFLYPQSRELILIQAKYILESSNVNSRAYYSDPKKISKITNAVNKKFGIDLNKIYILYISTVEYNNRNSFEILNNKKINCLFYSVTKDNFTTNFKDIIFSFEPTESCQIFPPSDKFSPQIYTRTDKLQDLLLAFTSLEKKEQSSDKKNQGNFEAYKIFINFLKTKQIKNNLINHLGEFCTNISNDYSVAQIVFDMKYIIFCKVKKNKEIDYSKRMILAYEEDNALVFYDLEKNKILNDYNTTIKKVYKEYYYIIGKWIDDKIINLVEKK